MLYFNYLFLFQTNFEFDISVKMTRFARASDGNRKRPLDASDWNELKKEDKKRKKEKTTTKKLKKTQHKCNDDNVHKEKVEQTKDAAHHSKTSGEPSDKLSSLESRLRNLSQKKTTELQLQEAYKKVKRSEDRRLKRIQKKQDELVCYNCRGSGHLMADCPEAKRDIEQGTGICFKCGSTEHSSSRCSVKLPPGKFPYAKCFICGETGHLSKQCPDNPKGLYPMGGCCKICESVEHYQRDCPELQSQQGVKSYCLPTINAHSSVDAEVDIEEISPTPVLIKKKGPKTVVF